MMIYHGSQNIISNPEYGKGKLHNDYGQGFYCTENVEIGKEWGCSDTNNGILNIYELDMTNLKVLNLNDPKYNILHWITLLIKNRHFRLTNQIAKLSKDYLLNHYLIDTSSYDVIIGYRADDSYFSFAEDFLNNTIPISKLKEAMRLGNLGEQIVLISPKAFRQLSFIGYEEVNKNIYYPLKFKRDFDARQKYLKSNRNIFDETELFMIDIIRKEIQQDDSRL